MDDNTLMLLGVVGLAVVCGGLFLIGSALVARVTGRGLIGALFMIARGVRGSEDPGPAYVPPQRPDLRSIAETHDFESALARVDPRIGSDGPAAPPPPADSPSAPSLDTADYSSLGDGWTSIEPPPRRNRDYGYDEAHGGAFEEGGEGW
jgi:hypothetical protein